MYDCSPAGRRPRADGDGTLMGRFVDDAEPADPGGDRDLALVALKCLTKTPPAVTSRRGAADELGDHWLSGEPLSVRHRAGGPGVAVAWLRRKTQAAAAAAPPRGGVGADRAVGPGGAAPAVLLLPPDAGPLQPARWPNAAMKRPRCPDRCVRLRRWC